MHNRDTDLDHTDTLVGRYVHEQGKIDLSLLLTLLARARQQRDLSLTQLLHEQGLIDPHEAEALTQRAHAEIAARQHDTARLSASGHLELHHSTDTISSGERPRIQHPEVGALVGEYRLLELLGKGRTGTVFLAESAQGERYALKTIVPESESARSRVEREITALSALAPHPNVVRLHDYGIHQGTPYVVQELLAREDLRDLLRRRQPEFEEAVEILRGVAAGLAHLHGFGVLHRDLKPANVGFDPEGVPKLIDFGLARPHGASRITRTGAIVGTPAYMAPEQALTDCDVSPKSDVYALGVLTYRLLSGELPFAAATLMDLLVQLVSTPAPPLREAAPDAPVHLEALCHQLLAKDPRERPTANEVVDALWRYRSREQTPSSSARLAPRGPWDPLQRVLVGVSLVLGGSVLSLLLQRQLQGAPAPSALAPPSSQAQPELTHASLPTPIPCATPTTIQLTSDAKLLWSPFGRSRVSLQTWTSLWLVLTPEHREAGVQVFRARLQRLATRWSMSTSTDAPSDSADPDRQPDPAAGARSDSFDSQKEADSSHPLLAALNRAFWIHVDVASGEVVEVEGVEALQVGINARVPAGARESLFQVPLLASHHALRETLSGLLSRGCHPSQRWTSPRLAPYPLGRAELAQGARRFPPPVHPPGLVARFERLEAEGTETTLRWSAKRAVERGPYTWISQSEGERIAWELSHQLQRELAGEATYDHVGLLQATARDAWRGKRDMAAADVQREAPIVGEVETTYRRLTP